jgi:hypothetical protein
MPDPLGMEPPLLTRGPRGQPWAWAPARALAASNHHERGWEALGHAPNTRGGRGHLDVTSGYHRLSLGTHVSNSAEQTGTVRLDPCVILNKEISWPYRVTGRDQATWSSDSAHL